MKSNTYYIVRIIFSFVILMLTVFIFSCTDEDPDGSAYAPELTVGGTNDLGRTSATVSGKFGGKLTRVKEYGVKYSTSSLFPDDQTTRVSFEGNPASGNFSTQLTGLSSNTQYYFCLYATTGATEVTSSMGSFSTVSTSKPSFTDVSLDSIGENTVVVRFRISEVGDEYLVEQGVSYRKKSTAGTEESYIPVTTDSLADATTREYISVLDGLTASTQYEIRPYAKNSSDANGDNGMIEGYGDTQTFTTEAQRSPVVEMYDPNNIGISSVELSGIVTSAPGSNGVLDEIGFCYVEGNKTPTWRDDCVIIDAKDLNTVYTITLTELREETTYSVRMFARNTVDGSARYGYGETKTFTTGGLQTPIFDAFTNISVTAQTITLTANLSTEGYDENNVAERGFYWAVGDYSECTLDKASILGNSLKVTDGGSSFTATISNLRVGEQYYVAAYAIYKSAEKELTGYSDIEPISTSAFTAASLGNVRVSDETYFGATVQGVINSQGNGTITRRGFVVSRDYDKPTRTNCDLDRTADDTFKHTFTELSAGTNYYVRAYAICTLANDSSTVYSDATMLTTVSVESGSLKEVTVESVTYASATVSSGVLSQGDGELTEAGFCWAASADLAGNVNLENAAGNVKLTDLSNLTDQFSAEITGLDYSKEYKVRAYIKTLIEGKLEEVSYSSTANFTTTEPQSASLNTLSYSNVSLHTVDVSVEMSSAGDGTVVERGFCWVNLESISYWNSVTLENKEGSLVVADGDGTETAFQATLTGLNQETQYRVAAYVITELNGVKYTAYSSYRDITTSSPQLPSMNAPTVSNLSYFSASFKLNMYDEGNYTITRKGVVLSSKESEPVINDNEFIQDFAESDSCTVTGLTQNTTYYVRSFAVCSLDGTETTTYSDYRSFSTSSVGAPQFGDLSLSNETLKGFDASTVIRENGDGTVTERGFCWAPTSNLSYYWDAVTLDNAEGSQAVWGDDFSVTLTGLANSTSYRVAAYVKYQVNNYQYEGVAYSSSSTITTSSPNLPSLSSPTLNSVSFFEAALKLEFNSEGNYNITEKGICISSKISDPAIGENEGIQYIYQGDTCKFYNLSPGTRYYARAFAKCVLDEDSATVYSSYRSFNTSDISSPTLKSLEISDITLKTMNASCGLREAGDGEIYEKGFCWVKTSSLSYYYDSPTLENATGSMVVSDGTTDTYSGMIQNLEKGTEYRVAAYMKYQVGNYQYTSVAYSSSSTVSTVSPSLPSLSSPTLNSVSFFDASLKFELSSEGNYTITSRGICISSKISNPVIAENEQIRYISDSDTLQFDNLTYNTTYYARSFATCSLDGDNQTVYSSYRSFRTSDITAPTLKSLETSNVTFTSIDASCGLRESNDGVITEKGFCWAKTADLDSYYTSPTLENATGTLKIDDGDTDTYSATISNLEMNTEYNIAAYMKYQVGNGQFTGVAYSDYSRLSTNNPQTISLNSPSISDITYKSAKFTNRVSSEGDYEITESGVVLSTDTSSPTIETHDFQAKYDENGTCTITGLTPYTRYYFRSYASGTLNGQSVVTYSGYSSFYSSSLEYPTVSTPTVDNSSYTSADVAFSLQSEGSYIVTERGICLSSKTSEPSVTNNEFSYKLEDGETSHTFTGLTTNTTYYVRSYVVCNVDGDETTEATRYSSSTNFKTSQLAAATFNSMSTSNSTLTTLDATASIGELGDGELVEHGFIWQLGGYSSDLKLDHYDGILKVDGTDKDFSATITKLLPDKYYYVKAYARTSLQGLETVGYSSVDSKWTSDYGTNNSNAVATSNSTEQVTFTFDSDDIVGLMTECGVVYSKNEVDADQMTLSAVAKVSDTDSKSFIVDLEKLDSNVRYYYYIYVKLEGGMSYKGRWYFTTKAIPSVDDNVSPTKKD